MAYDFWANFPAARTKGFNASLPHPQDGRRHGRHAVLNAWESDEVESRLLQQPRHHQQTPTCRFSPSAESLDPTTRRLLSHWDRECREQWQASDPTSSRKHSPNGDFCPDIWAAIKDRLED